jgi:hypothetical protein
MNRFRALRKLLKGNERAAQFFRENIGRVVHRDVMQALLYDQNDFMKRLRKNGGAPDTLGKEDIAILIGTYRRARELAEALGFNGLKTDEIVGVQPRSLAEWQLMSTAGIIASNQWVG